MPASPKRARVLPLISKHFAVPRVEIRRSTRGSPRAAEARQAMMLVLHLQFGDSFTSIGLRLDRDRKTVSHGVYRMMLYRTMLPELNRRINAVLGELQQ